MMNMANSLSFAPKRLLLGVESVVQKGYGELENLWD